MLEGGGGISSEMKTADFLKDTAKAVYIQYFTQTEKNIYILEHANIVIVLCQLTDAFFYSHFTA